MEESKQHFRYTIGLVAGLELMIVTIIGMNLQGLPRCCEEIVWGSPITSSTHQVHQRSAILHGIWSGTGRLDSN